MSVQRFLPSLIVHCDWGSAPGKRWMARATLTDGGYTALAPEPVGDLSTLMQRIAKLRGRDQAALVGFDFPIGLPKLYAEQAQIWDFSAFLLQIGSDNWKAFYDICNDRADIYMFRPFYPYNFTPAGTRKRKHLLDGLALNSFNDLLRQCEQPQPLQKIRAAGPLFWTLGANAPGRGAIQGWNHVLAPALRERQVKLWSFDGDLAELLQPGTTVVAETYPTQYHPWIFGYPILGKGVPAVRCAQANPFLSWAADHRVGFTAELETAIRSGFPSGKDDSFDAVIGLCGMIEIALGDRPEGNHPDSTLRNIEGWILGQPCR